MHMLASKSLMHGTTLILCKFSDELLHQLLFVVYLGWPFSECQRRDTPEINKKRTQAENIIYARSPPISYTDTLLTHSPKLDIFCIFALVRTQKYIGHWYVTFSFAFSCISLRHCRYPNGKQKDRDSP